jgi:hypothetical protein
MFRKQHESLGDAARYKVFKGCWLHPKPHGTDTIVTDAETSHIEAPRALVLKIQGACTAIGSEWQSCNHPATLFSSLFVCGSGTLSR